MAPGIIFIVIGPYELKTCLSDIIQLISQLLVALVVRQRLHLCKGGAVRETRDLRAIDVADVASMLLAALKKSAVGIFHASANLVKHLLLAILKIFSSIDAISLFHVFHGLLT